MISQKIDEPGKGARCREFLANIMLASFYIPFAWSAGTAFLASPRLSIVLLLIKETLDAVFAICRRMPKQVSSHVPSWGVAIGGTITPLLLRPSGSRDIFIAVLLQSLGFFLQIIAILSLNRSFGMVPANRGIKKNGMYKLVRHPLYASYTVVLLGFVISNPKVENLGLFLLATMFQIARIRREEELLSQDPEYQEYTRQTKWRMIPLVF